MKLICDAHLIYPAFDAPAVSIGGTVNTSEIYWQASWQRYGKPVGRCSGTERCTDFDL